MLVWILWNNRNNWVWNNVKDSGQQLCGKAMHLWNEWDAVQQIRDRNNSRPQVHQQNTQWKQPEFGWLKCNVDAGFHIEQGVTSAGWCVRDYLGQFVLAGTSWIKGKCSIIDGEALALFEAMKELERWGLTNVIFETDSKSVVDAIRCSYVGLSDFSILMCKIKQLLSLHLNFEVSFTK
ncbi:uncharacterized protein LOC123905578 [Trifolium pratense]|uniref:uncharacterized protein LOC123905578 n=1 Tax=Trifolium pratense TaxID=57577 RepID=UPI001E6977A0|nr:uncharacterized protein LOC123905578 [Trifolium pratense]XP_045811196.1 uncharacterized protein LOC123905578 [Trifolium pratense]